MPKANNNFTRPENTQKPSYKLRVYYKSQFVNAKLPKTKVYYSYDKPNNPHYGLRKLIEMLKSRKDKVETAILYNNQTNTEIERYRF